jgi:hypothetical protein
VGSGTGGMVGVVAGSLAYGVLVAYMRCALRACSVYTVMVLPSTNGSSQNGVSSDGALW